MNCLQFALLFWDKNPNYLIFYNGDHVINLTEPIGNYIPIESYGYEHIRESFEKTLYPCDLVKLKRYFNKENDKKLKLS